jgi:hypothetical protein
LSRVASTALLRRRRPGTAVVDPKNTHHCFGVKTMPKERNSRKEDKKKSTMTPKEKKAAKKSKKESKLVKSA